MPFAALADETRLYHELTGPKDGPLVMQFGGAMEEMDLPPLVPAIERPLLVTNGTYDILCSATSGTPTCSSARTRRCGS